MKKTIHFALASAALGVLPVFAASDCQKLALSVHQSVVSERSDVLEIVEAQVKANPDCACEVVKAAIEGSVADTAKVASIVEVAATAAPEQMRLISQCAVAIAPDALADVQAVLAKLDPNAGESGYSAKSAKGEVASEAAAAPTELPNPLDFPGSSSSDAALLTNSPPGSPTFVITPGGPGGPGGPSGPSGPSGPGGPPIVNPPTTPPVTPPAVSDVD
jgi:hypothetical protein